MEYDDMYHEENSTSTLGSITNTALQALYIANEVRGLLNTEFKYKDAKKTATSVTNSASAVPDILVEPAAGTSEITRVGNSILLKDLKIKGWFGYNSGGSADQVVRIMIFVDKSSTAATLADLIEDTATTYTPISPLKYDYANRYIVLFDKTYNLNVKQQAKSFTIEMKNLNIHSQYVTGGVTISSNALKLAYMSNVLTTAPTIDYYSRCTYIDN